MLYLLLGPAILSGLSMLCWRSIGGGGFDWNKPLCCSFPLDGELGWDDSLCLVKPSGDR